MKFKLAQSESDGFFMKANRKHQILLNFELKRIAVEQKMRERYFAFEKSLVVAHQTKIITRQKSLGIYRPKSSSPVKTTNKQHGTNPFFISNVSMETKSRPRLPPLTDEKGKGKASAGRLADERFVTSSSRKNYLASKNTSRRSSFDVKQSWSLTEVADDKSLIKRLADDSKDEAANVDDAVDADKNMPKNVTCTDRGMSSIDDKNHTMSPIDTSQQLYVTTKKSSTVKKNASKIQENKATDTIIDFKETTSSNQKLEIDQAPEAKTHRAKSANSIENSVEEVRTELRSINLRAISAGVKA